MRKVIIAGGRDFDDYTLLESTCDKLIPEDDNIEIVSGRQATYLPKEQRYIGADYFGEMYAREKGYPIKSFPANWMFYGGAAGPIRNKAMAEYSDILIAFWDGKSKGTRNMISLAKELWLTVHVITYNS